MWLVSCSLPPEQCGQESRYFGNVMTRPWQIAREKYKNTRRDR